MVLFLAISAPFFAFASGGCNVNVCPGGRDMCCTEKKSILWGAYEWEVTHYTNRSIPTQ
ncbi:hypothetical protein BC751_0090 [Cecembia calidifontis]|nr:hypothetical protein BC751_0090 [Cecembia calidifontis]